MPIPKISREEFVRAWMLAYKLNKGQQWVADQVGLRAAGVYARSTNLRGQGVHLPFLKGTQTYTSIINERDSLNQIIKEELGGQDANI